MLKSSIRNIIAQACYSTNRRLNRLNGKVVILMYHRVITDKELNQYFIQPGMYVKNDTFEMQMKFLRENFEIISFKELLDLMEEKRLDKNKRYCVITFDDGWLDNYIYAYPVLKKYNIPATIFLPTSYIGTDDWFWPDKLGYLLNHFSDGGNLHKNKLPISILIKEGFGEIINGIKFRPFFSSKFKIIDSIIEACKGLHLEVINKLILNLTMALGKTIPSERMLLNWNEVKELSDNGISFGSHSKSHRILIGLSESDIKDEINGSIKTLEEKGINYIPVFCYPDGKYNFEIINHLKKAGYIAAVSTQIGYEDNLSKDLYVLKRIGIHNDITSTIPLFKFRISRI